MRHSIVKLIAAVALAAASVAGAAGTAVATQSDPDYPLSPCAVTTSFSFAPGSTIPITGTGGSPNGTTTFYVTLPNGSVRELTGQNDADGKSTVTFITPNQTGTYTVVAVCPDQASSPPTTGVGKLPVTGSDPWGSLRLAGVLVVLGGGIFIVARKRRQETAVA